MSSSNRYIPPHARKSTPGRGASSRNPPTRIVGVNQLPNRRKQENQGNKEDRANLPNQTILEREMKKFGVQETSDFWCSMLRKLDSSSGSKCEEPPNILVTLPEEPIDCIKEVLRQEFRALLGKSRIVTVDHLQGLPTPPFSYDRKTKEYVLNIEFEEKKISREAFVPFARYSFEPKPSKVEKIESLEKKLSKYSWAEDYVYTALMAWGVQEYLPACPGCEMEKTIRWNSLDDGIVDRGWKNLVCENEKCGSCFELVCMAKKLRRGGGFTKDRNYFDRFSVVQKQIRSSGKQFVCLMEMPSKENKEDWQVHVAKVIKVQPRLKVKSFFEEKIYSNMLYDRPACSFKIPFIDDLDPKTVAQEVFDEEDWKED